MPDAFSIAHDLVARSSRILALTGAGLSTASGIPDFRGPQGRWTQDPDAEKISTLSYYLTDEDVRRKAWRARAHSAHGEAAPNAGHLALVDLERAGKLAGIVTQNTDGLHLVAGSSPQQARRSTRDPSASPPETTSTDTITPPRARPATASAGWPS